MCPPPPLPTATRDAVPCLHGMLRPPLRLVLLSRLHTSACLEPRVPPHVQTLSFSSLTTDPLCDQSLMIDPLCDRIIGGYGGLRAGGLRGG